MKGIIWISIICLAMLAGCKDDDCIVDNKCSETHANGELCQAAFESWFYNAEEKKCTKIGYSGCNEYGFKTQEECEECDCEKESKK